MAGTEPLNKDGSPPKSPHIAKLESEARDEG